MKKFVFSLYALFEMKKTQKDQLQTEYAEAEALLDQALREKAALDKVCADESERYEAKVKKGITAGDIGAHAVYFADLREKIAAAAGHAAFAQEEAARKQTALIEVFKEVKSLEKLRQKQYREYLMEGAKRETSICEDILSFQVTEKETGLGNAGTVF